jgi:hypothetical protein
MVLGGSLLQHRGWEKEASMTAVITEAKFSFLVSGPILSLSIPEEFAGLPELSSPLVNGVGARSFNFLTPQRDKMPTNFSFIRTLIDPQGRVVELYDWRNDPPQWFLRWPLKGGSLWTHLREEDGPDLADSIVGNLDIVEDSSTSAPFLLPNPPLRSAVSSRAGYHESATYFSSTRSGWKLKLQRPGHLVPGQTMMLPQEISSVVVMRGGAANGVEIVAVGSDLGGVRDVLQTAASSLIEA